MKDFETTTVEERDAFITSFNYVLCDMHGVLWQYDNIIFSARDAITSLCEFGKRVLYVTNTSSVSRKNLYKTMKKMLYNLDKTDLIFPSAAIVDYLKKNHFSQRIFLIGLPAVQKQLKKAGFKVEKLQDRHPEKTVEENFPKKSTQADEVGAVVVDWDPYVTGLELEKAIAYLRNPSVLFIIGDSNKKIRVREDLTLIGPGMYHTLLEEMSGRKPLRFGKPDIELSTYIREQFGILDPSKVLVIGDSIPEDMGFATVNGYQKLLVLSGETTKEDIDEWKFPENYKPKYYINSLTEFYECLKFGDARKKRGVVV